MFFQFINKRIIVVVEFCIHNQKWKDFYIDTNHLI